MNSLQRFIQLLVFGLVIASAQPALAGQRIVTASPSSRDVILSGFTRAKATLTLVSEQSGRTKQVFADIGDTVGKQGLFAALDATFIRLDLEQNSVRQEQLRSRIQYDQTEAERYRQLVTKGSAAQSKLDGLEQTLDTNRHDLAALEVEGRILREKLRRTRIPAPKGWRITARSMEPGQWINAGQEVGEAGDFSVLLVPFALTPEQYDALRRIPQPVILNMADLGTEVPARIFRVNPGFDPETRKIQIELAIHQGLPERRGGLRAELSLPMPEQTGAVLLPHDAVTERYEEHWVTREGGTQVKVVVLGNNSGQSHDLLRVTAPSIKPGDTFRAGKGD